MACLKYSVGFKKARPVYHRVEVKERGLLLIHLLVVLFRFASLSLVKIISLCFYRIHIRWNQDQPPKWNEWSRLRLGILLNHTSLFEPIFLGGMPWIFLWHMARRGVFPIADLTFQRPIAGRFYTAMGNATPVTRVRDESWDTFMASVRKDSLVLILPEGRMKRKNGLDKDGQVMTVRGGVADILKSIPDGMMLIAVSGGLHHVQAPGEGFPTLFRRVFMSVELVEVASFVRPKLASGSSLDPSHDFKQAVIEDLTKRRDQGLSHLAEH